MTARFKPVPETFAPTYPHYTGLKDNHKWTTYGNMNEWMKFPGRTIPENAPVTLSDGNWRQIPMLPGGRPNVYDSTPEERFQKAYKEMTQRIAYRYPNPGMPKSRQGRIGGNWRHIKEVLGHGGSQICSVDGLVRLYDGSNLNEEMAATAPCRPHLTPSKPRYNTREMSKCTPTVPPRTPRCTYNRYDVSDHQGRVQTHRAYEYERCLPNIQPSQGAPQTSGKYQGFYRLK